MGTYTTNYAFFKPNKLDSMADFTTNLNNNWDAIATLPSPTIITGALPQVGTYNIGDRVFRTNDNSSYVLIAKDSNWGWFWRPVQVAISPWITVPAAVNLLSGSWTFAPDASNPFAFALDNRGNCHWRGAIGVSSGVITANFSFAPIATLPVGARPRESNMYQLGYFGSGPASGEIEGARVFINEVGTVSIRVQGNFATTNPISKVFFDGKVRFAIGNAHYLAP